MHEVLTTASQYSERGEPMHEQQASSGSRPDLDTVIADYLRRADQGERIDRAAFIAAHPDLADDLCKYFSHAVALDHAAGLTATAGFTQHVTPHSGLEVRCPNCHQPTEVAADTTLTDLTCSACGSHFSLVDQGRDTRMAPSLTKLGRFELVERLGFGGFGSVWKARDKELDRTVAIKIPRAGDMTAEDQEKFFREARAAAQLKHPSIVSVHEVGRDGDSVYIVSDFVRGVTLGDWLTGQKLTSRESAELCAKIADALHHAHEQGIIHRDLKPANVMIDGDGEPHLMDFGLARREVGEVTVTMDGHVLGTPAYMSPEQARGEAHHADRRSDIYSLGVILFQLLTGELPFRGNARMLVHQVINDEPPSPRKLNSNVPKDLETITLKCLEKDPDKRYQSAHSVAEELRRWLRGDVITARPVGRIERGWRWGRRNKMPVAAGLAIAGSLLALLAVSLIYAGNQRELANDRAKLVRETESARLDSEAKLYRALLGRSAASRMARTPGYRSDVWGFLHEAESLNIPGRNLNEFRDEITACMGDPIGLPPITSPKVARTQSEVPSQFVPLIKTPGVTNYAVSPDRRWLVTATKDYQSGDVLVELRDESGTAVKSKASTLSDVRDVAYSSDGRSVILGCEQGFTVWQVPDFDAETVIRGNVVVCVATQPNGHLFAVKGRSTWIEIRSAISNRIVTAFSAPKEVEELEFSADGNMLLGLNRHGSEILVGWFVGDAPEKRSLGGHREGVPDVAFSSDGRVLATASKDKTVRLWDAETGKSLHVCEGHSREIETVTFSPTGGFLVSGDMAGEIRAWDVLTGEQLGQTQHGTEISDLEFDTSGSLLVTTGQRATKCWEVTRTKSGVEFEPFAHIPNPDIGLYNALSIHPGGSSFAAVDHLGRLFSYDLSKNRTRELFEFPAAQSMRDFVHFDHVGQKLRFVTEKRTIGTIDVRQRRMVHETPDRFFIGGGFTISADDRWAAFPDEGRRMVVVYDMENDRPLHSLPPEASEIWHVEWSPDAKRLAVGVSDGLVALWNLEEVRSRVAEFGIDVPSTAVNLDKLPQRPQMPRTQFKKIVSAQRRHMLLLVEADKLLVGSNAAHRNEEWEKAIEQCDQAIVVYKRLLDESPDTKEFRSGISNARNTLAWWLATSPPEEWRNGERAVELGTMACEATEYKDANIIDTLAAAYAESGDFDKAVELQRKAIDLVPESDGAMAGMRSRLALYLDQKPYRDEPKP